MRRWRITLGSWLLAVALGSCRRPPERPIRRDSITRTSKRVWHATVLYPDGIRLSRGERCRIVARVGHEPDGRLNLLFRGRCGGIAVLSPLREDLGTGETMEYGLLGCTLTPIAGTRSEALSCPAPRGPPPPSEYTLKVDGTAARIERQWFPRWRLDLEWEPASEAIAP